jgi:hypothetical protein
MTIHILVGVRVAKKNCHPKIKSQTPSEAESLPWAKSNGDLRFCRLVLEMFLKSSDAG